MILSVSRRTDIPAFYFDWFINRLEEGFLYVKNPINPKQVSKIILNRETIDCIVFWTKNPSKLLSQIDKLEDYMYYFQYTLNPYGKDIEKNLPQLHDRLETSITLSKMIGRERIIWRYDPIFFTDDIDVQFHIDKFTEMTKILRSYTNTVVVSILDYYRKIKKSMESIGYRKISNEELSILLLAFKKTADQNNLKIYSCAEELNLREYGIMPGKCIDDTLISKLLGEKIEIKKDKNQREVCGCVKSIEVGAYNTCLHGCSYCYANYSDPLVKENYKSHDKNSPLLIGNIESDDKITERKIKAYRNLSGQIKMFD